MSSSLAWFACSPSEFPLHFTSAQMCTEYSRWYLDVTIVFLRVPVHSSTTREIAQQWITGYQLTPQLWDSRWSAVSLALIDMLLVPRARLAIMQFSIVGPSAWNDLPFELRSVLMAHPSKFYISLKSFFFVRGWAGSAISTERSSKGRSFH